MTLASATSEGSRQLLHMAMGSFALLLPYLAWWQSVLCAMTALAFNIFAIGRISPSVFRPGELHRPARSGIILYPAAVLALLLLFPDRLDIVAAAWGVLAVGDAMATIIGRRLPVRPLAWNPQKSIGGAVSLAVFGGAAGSFLAWWCSGTVVPHPYWWYPVAGGFGGACIAALVESMPLALDDNISVPAASAATLWVISQVTEDGLRTAMSLLSTVPVALLANALIAAAGYRARTVTAAGAVAGAGIGTIIAVCAGWKGWMLLLATFACAVITSRLGLRRKLLLGIAEERGGRRGAGNAVANTGVAALAALLAVLGSTPEAALLAFVAALAAGGSDTVASELGKAWGRTTYLITSARRVPPGTSGALSLEGTLAGLAGATLLGGAGIALQLAESDTLLPIVAGATAGSLAESVMGATLEPRGLVNNDVLNFLNTAIAAWVAVGLWRLA